MRLYDWLRDHSVRLRITVQAIFDPRYPEPRWRCEIGGIMDSDEPHNLPAVFLQYANGREASIVAFGDDPNEAFANAVNLLRGKRVNVILRDQDDFFTIPDVTP